MMNEAASSVNPTLVPDRSDTDTGIGQGTADRLDLIAGARSILYLQEVTGIGVGVTASFDSTCRIIAPYMQQYISCRYSVDNTAQTGLHVAFNTFSYGGTVVTLASSGITYSPTTGRFTFSTGGVYKISVTAFLTHSVTTPLNSFYIRRNGITILWQAFPTVHSSVDPVERTIDIIYQFDDNDYVELLMDSNATATLQTNVGTTMTINKLA
jgi:hypothetical protein